VQRFVNETIIQKHSVSHGENEPQTLHILPQLLCIGLCIGRILQLAFGGTGARRLSCTGKEQHLDRYHTRVG